MSEGQSVATQAEGEEEEDKDYFRLTKIIDFKLLFKLEITTTTFKS